MFFSILFRKSLPTWRSWSYSPRLSFRSFIVLPLTFNVTQEHFKSQRTKASACPFTPLPKLGGPGIWENSFPPGSPAALPLSLALALPPGPGINKNSELPVVFGMRACSNFCQDSGSKWGPPSPLHMYCFSHWVWDKLIHLHSSGGPQMESPGNLLTRSFPTPL